MSKIGIAVGVSALVIAGGATAANAASHHVSPGCKVVSVTHSQPAYSTATDHTGTVVVTTVMKCRGKTTTTQSVEVVYR